jgi:hypothetical protein
MPALAAGHIAQWRQVARNENLRFAPAARDHSQLFAHAFKAIYHCPAIRQAEKNTFFAGEKARKKFDKRAPLVFLPRG